MLKFDLWSRHRYEIAANFQFFNTYTQIYIFRQTLSQDIKREAIK